MPRFRCEFKFYNVKSNVAGTLSVTVECSEVLSALSHSLKTLSEHGIEHSQVTHVEITRSQ